MLQYYLLGMICHEKFVQQVLVASCQRGDPYNRIISVVALNSWISTSLWRPLFQIDFNLCKSFSNNDHFIITTAKILEVMLSSVRIDCLFNYVTKSNSIIFCCELKNIYWFFFALILRPTFEHSSSTMFSRANAWFISLERRTMSSANSRSVITFTGITLLCLG